MTLASAMSSIHRYFDGGEFEQELARRVAHRTESQLLPDSLPALHRYLDEEMIPAFEAMGFHCQVIQNPLPDGAPSLVATRTEGDALPTVLGYGHGDVIVGQENNWTKGAGPWTTALDGDRLYGRGTADNKAQHTINMAAMRSVLEARGSLGFNATFLIEMGEETGSAGLTELVTENRELFAADVLIASDGPRVAMDRPTISLGCRGAFNVDLVADFRDGGHHSGNWGGLIADPGVVLANALASIVGKTGELLVPALKAEPMSDAVRETLEDIEIDGGPDGPKIDTWWGEPDLTPPQRVHAANTFNVLAFVTGNPQKPVNAIPPKAVANCQLRFVTGTDPATIVPSLRAHLDRNGFHQIEVVVPGENRGIGFPACRTEPDHPWAVFVRDTVAAAIGAKPAVIPSIGGSLPNDVFGELLGLPTIWIPHSYTGCSQHAPDEHVLLPTCRSALEVMTSVYWAIGETGGPSMEAR
ncbi:MAG: M20 family metallopeptidase [Actinomycetota bacterium]